jgi:hypothetical protein
MMLASPKSGGIYASLEIRKVQTSRSKTLVMDLPDDEAALALAKFIAQRARREVVISDGADVELWTVRPDLDS